MITDTRVGVANLRNRPASDFGGGQPEFAAAPSNSIQTARPHLPVLPWGGDSLPWRIARFTVAFALIIVASYFLGEVLRRWVE
jgi:hypothetical protein